jgi:Tol biopolymer transport system component
MIEIPREFPVPKDAFERQRSLVADHVAAQRRATRVTWARQGRRRWRLVAVIAAALVVAAATASSFAMVREFLFGSRESVTLGPPTWSPDGRRIAFVSTSCVPRRNVSCVGTSEIAVIGLDGRAQQNISQEVMRNGIGPAILSPDWRRLAFVRDRGLYREYADGSNLHYTDIVVTNIDGSRRRAVTPKGFYDAPVWSPDGTRIAFVRYRGDDADVYVANADGSGLRKLAHALAYDPNPLGAGKGPSASPAWSPDGRKIAFVSNRSGSDDIWVVDAEGGGLVNLTRSRGSGRPVWSPNGRLIAFRSDRDGNGEVYVMNADGSGVKRLTRNPASDGGPVWSPDGRKILFVRFRRGNSDIYVMNRDGSGQRNLTPGVRPARTAYDGAPVWSPSGRLIAFVSERDKRRKVYVMTADGSDQAALGTFVDVLFPVGRISRSAGDVRFSLSVPRVTPQWENGPIEDSAGRWTIRNHLIRRSLVRGQAAEVMIYWTALRGNGPVSPCAKLLSPSLARSSIDDVAPVVAKAPGTELVAGPTRVTLGGYPARYVELVVHESRGCDPGFLFTWRDHWAGALWGGTERGDRIRAWIVDVNGRRLFFVAETKEGFNHPLRPPPSKPDLQRAGRDVTKIVESIRFD